MIWMIWMELNFLKAWLHESKKTTESVKSVYLPLPKKAAIPLEHSALDSLVLVVTQESV